MRVSRVRRLLFAVVGVIVALQFQVQPAQAATSPIDQRYAGDAAVRTLLGPPTGAEYAVGVGRGRNYQWGSLYWSAATGVHEVHGAIRYRYNLLGGPTGRLGFPKTDEGRMFIKYDVPDQVIGARNDFQNGALVWYQGASRAIWMSKPFADAVPYQTYPYWARIEADERAAGTDSRMVDAGTLLYRTPQGTFEVRSGYPPPNYIEFKYREKNLDNGFLGVPTGNERPVQATATLRPGAVQSFRGGRIYECGDGYEPCFTDGQSAFEVHGAILWRFDAVGGLARLGYPISDEQITTGGRVSHFERGDITWNATTNVTTVTYH